MDIDPRIGIARSLARLKEQKLDEGRFEKMDFEFHDRVRASFLSKAAARPDSHAIVNAGEGVEQVLKNVREIVFKKFRIT